MLRALTWLVFCFNLLVACQWRDWARGRACRYERLGVLHDDPDLRVVRVGRSAAPDLAADLECAGVVPAYVHGRPGGVRISGIREGSLAFRLGLRNADIVTSAEGIPLLTPAAAFAAYERLQDCPRIGLRVRRAELELELVILRPYLRDRPCQIGSAAPVGGDTVSALAAQAREGT